MIKRSPNKSLYAILLAGTLISGVSADLIADRIFKDPKTISDHPIRQKLLAKKNTNSNPKLTKSFGYSTMLYDLCPQSDYYGALPWSEKVPRNPSGDFLFAWRIKLPFRTDFFIKAPKNIKDNYSIKILSGEGSTIFIKTNNSAIPQESLNIDPGVYLIKMRSGISLDNFKFNFKFSDKDKLKEPDEISKFEKLNIKLDRLALKDIKRFVKLCEDPPGGLIGRMPRGRVRATIEDTNKGSFFKARIGLAGRTVEHLEGFPSLDVKLKPGYAFKGLTCFKLYKMETKCGFHDFVFLSALKDMGFFVPRQEIVELSVNSEIKGLYVLMETPSPAMFLNQNRSEGSIIGVDINKLFFNYPVGGLLEGRNFYKNNAVNSDLEDMDLFLTNSFTDRLDRKLLAQYIAFTSIYSSSHGLGVDDLRFYKDPITGYFSPMPRDLNPGVWYHPTHFRAYVNDLKWLVRQPYYTIHPTTYLQRSKKSKDTAEYFNNIQINTTIGVIDMHFAVINFLYDSSNFSLTNKYLLYFAQNEALRHKILSRAVNVYNRMVFNYPDSMYLKEAYAKLAQYGIPFYGSLIRDIFEDKREVYFKHKNELFSWNFRTRLNMDEKLLPGFMCPFMPGIKEEVASSQLMLSFLCEEEMFSAIEKETEIPVKTFKKVSKVEDGAKILDIDSLISADDSGKPPFSDIKEVKDVDIIFLSNIVLYLGRIFPDDKEAIICFLVRNTFGGESSYTLRARDGLANYKPFVNKKFRLGAKIPGVKNRASIRQIILNHFAPGEDMRVIAFKVNAGNNAAFYNLEIPENHYFYFPKSIYIPSLRKLNENAPDSLYPDGFMRKGKDFYISENITVNIDQDVILPKGSSLYVGKGVRFIISSGNSVKVRGNLNVDGESENPVIFTSKPNDTCGKIYVESKDGKKSRVVVRNTKFENFSGLILHNTDAYLENIEIISSRDEDAINCVSSFVRMKNIKALDSFSDAIDLDFSDALIEGLIVSGSRGDGLDISSSLVVCERSIFESNKDKGVSVGEMSNVFLNNCILRENNLGIANKDQSRLGIANTVFLDNEIAVAEFIKKPYFGKPISFEKNIRFKGNKHDYKWLGFYSY